MKRILFFIAVCIATITVQAQSNDYGHGYRGFADLGYTFGVGDYEFGRFEISTTHGYQVNPHFFVGGGVGFHFMSEYETKSMEIPLDVRKSKISIPLFCDFRATIGKRKFSPFADLKLGYFVTNGDGFYGNLSIGCRMALKDKQGISLSVGYVAEQLEFQTFDRFTGKYMDYTRRPRKLDCEGISIKLSYEF